jgi:hypothetical protein
MFTDDHWCHRRQYILEFRGTSSQEKIGSRGTAAITVAYFALFCVMAFAIAPLALRRFIVLQVKIGNWRVCSHQWFQAHEQAGVYGFWSMMAIGICIFSVPVRDDILKNMR